MSKVTEYDNTIGDILRDMENGVTPEGLTLEDQRNEVYRLSELAKREASLYDVEGVQHLADTITEKKGRGSKFKAGLSAAAEVSKPAPKKAHLQLLKGGLKSLGPVAAVGTALMSGDASAAIDPTGSEPMGYDKSYEPDTVEYQERVAAERLMQAIKARRGK